MDRVRISLPPGRAETYEVVIEPGLLPRLGALVQVAAPAVRYAIIADATVAALYADAVGRALSGEHARADLFTFGPGEPSKTRETWAALTDRLLEAGFGRDACVIGLGGGVTADLAGFLASTYMRGVPVVQVPTSLLAMIDASIGGKTGVDTAAGKNLVGAFQQPALVAIDPETLRTLPESELRSGLAEAIKHGAIADRAYLDWIASNAGALLARDAAALARLVRRSVEIKAEFVMRDPREQGARAALNFGHTIAHAIERATAYAVPHGFAVAAGMVLEAELAIEAGLARAESADLIRGVLEAVGLPADPPAGLDPAALLRAAGSDKKARDGRVRFALISEPGTICRTTDGAWTHALDPDRVLRVLGRNAVL